MAAGKGTILALHHLGGWEWAGRWLTDRGYRMTVVVERLEPPELFEWFTDLRQRLGMTVVATGPAPAAVLGTLRDGEVVCLLCDHDLGATGWKSSSSVSGPPFRPDRPPWQSVPGPR